MSLLRIRVSLAGTPSHCQWALVDDGQAPVSGEGLIADLPHHSDRVQLLIPAAEVLITRARLPHVAKSHSGSVLAYAVEDQIAGEPDANQVSWIGAVGDNDVLAVIDRQGLKRWRDVLDTAGIQDCEVQCETLILPLPNGEWSISWNGHDGFVRHGDFEGAATDLGDRETPPLSLCMLLETAQAQGTGPTSIGIYETIPDAAPDLKAWAKKLGCDVHLAGTWDWRTVPSGAGISLVRTRQRWRGFAGTAVRLRTAAWVFGAALLIHGVALVIDWTSLASEQRTLRQKMESRFRATFPDAVAVADPVLQMRRKLAEARHAAGQPDGGDFLPMIELVAVATKTLPAGAVRTLSYESGRMTLELGAVDEASVRRLVATLRQSGLSVDRPPASGTPSLPANSMKVVLTVRAS